MKQKNTRWAIILLSAVLIGIFFLFGEGVIIGSKQNQDDISLELGIWTSENTFEQTFIAVQNRLARVDFYLDSYHPWDSPYLECQLFEIETPQVPTELTHEFIHQHLKQVRAKRLNGWLLSGHKFNSFSFAPIPDSQEKRYLLRIQSPGLKYGGSSILCASSKDRYDWGNLFVNGEKKEVDLAFRALYRQPRWKIIQESIARFTLQKPFPLSSPAAYYLLFGAYILLVLLLLCQFLDVCQTPRKKARKRYKSRQNLDRV